MPSLDEKIKRVFGEIAVNKRLARRHEFSRLPRFISEYLLSKYVRDENDVVGLRKIETIIQEHYPDPRDREQFLAILKTKGALQILDEIKVNVDLKRGIFKAIVPSLQLHNVLVREGLVYDYPRLLSGIWGIGTLRYVPDILDAYPSLSPVILEEFEPFQVYNIDEELFIEGRSEFTTEEWIDVIVQTIGLNPQRYTLEQKLILLSRLIPLIEPNVNVLELGPRATGKTHLYRNISTYVRIYAGGTVSPAQLFYNIRLRIIGDIGIHDVVVFDEIARLKFSNAEETIAKLKDYMVEGFYERGKLKRAHSTCSLVFLGNLDMAEYGVLGNLSDYLPEFMRSDTAVLDRIHGIIPGWELPKIMKSSEHLANGYGLSADYLSEILHNFRDKESFRGLVHEMFELDTSFTIRDEQAFERMASGLLKLIFPNQEIEKSWAMKIGKLATRMRQYVVDELSYLAPIEFPRKSLHVEVRK